MAFYKYGISNTVSFNELVSLIPTFIEADLKEQLLEKMDPRSSSITFTELEYAIYFFNSENFINVHWGMNIFLRYLKSNQYLPEQLRRRIFLYKKLIPKLIQITKVYNFPLLTFEAIEILFQITQHSPKRGKQVVENQGLNLLIQLLSSSFVIIANKAVLTILNILTYNQEYQKNVISLLSDKIRKNRELNNNIELSIEVLITFCSKFDLRSEGVPSQSLMTTLNTFFLKIQNYYSQSQIYKNSKSVMQLSWKGIVKIATKYKSLIPIQNEIQFFEKVIQFIRDDYLEISESALNLIGKFLEKDENLLITKHIIEQGLLSIIMLQGKTEQIEQILSIFHNLSSEQKLLYFIRNQEFIEYIFLKLKTESIGKSKLITFFYDATVASTFEDLKIFIDRGLFFYLLHLVQYQDQYEHNIEMSLYIINQILSKGKNEQNYYYAIELQKINGFNILARLQYHESQIIVILVSELLQNHGLL